MTKWILEESELTYGLPENRIIHGNALTVLKKFPPNSVDCVITSPPYWAKRDYGDETITEWEDGTKYQLGLEPTPELYVEHLIQIFRQIKRVLKPHGNVFVVIDDTYCGGGHGGVRKDGELKDAIYVGRNTCPVVKWSKVQAPRKSLSLVPELFAIRMVYELGFILRQKIIWAKKVLIYKEMETIGNAMPESCKDRNTHTYEFIYHFIKEPKYYYDQLRLPYKEETVGRMERAEKLMKKTGLPITQKNKYYQAVLNGKAEQFGQAGILTGRYMGKFSGMGKEAEKYGSPRARTQRNSKFLKSDIQTASPSGRLIRLLAEGKEDEVTLVRKAIDDVNAYLKRKLKESGLTVKQLAEMIGIKETTLAHYFRTDMSGAAIPPKNVWEAMKPILGLDDYEKHVKEEYKSVLPSPHPLGANSPDVVQINTEPFPEAHFAVFPTKLVEFLIKVGCPEQVCKKCGKPRERVVEKVTDDAQDIVYTIRWTDCGCGAGFEPGIVLDPFLGSGTTALVALKMNRKFVGIELNREYCKMALKRIKPYLQQARLTEVIECTSP